ncbi:MAG: hypothetical protein HOV77_14510, partial [Hamadaea sp.]|uniref:hypothetical protein n=1 Tax=Hamadaea sp. TaxID=2024425 RepID=UPI001804D39E
LRPAWQDTVSDAADLALLGIVALVASLPVVTAGAAVSAASRAVHDRQALGSLPSWRTTLGRFVRGLVPGIGATAVTLAVVALIIIDVRGLARGVVPGGGPTLALTLTVIGLIIGYAGLTVVAVGTGVGWRAAVRSAAVLAWRRPGTLVAAAGVGVIAILLAIAIPVTLPLVLGGWLHALHAVSAFLAARAR